MELREGIREEGKWVVDEKLFQFELKPCIMYTLAFRTRKPCYLRAKHVPVCITNYHRATFFF